MYLRDPDRNLVELASYVAAERQETSARADGPAVPGLAESGNKLARKRPGRR